MPCYLKSKLGRLDGSGGLSGLGGLFQTALQQPSSSVKVIDNFKLSMYPYIYILFRSKR